MSDYYSVSEAAKILNYTRQEIVRRIWRGFIKAEKIGNFYIIPKSEIKPAKRQKDKK